MPEHADVSENIKGTVIQRSFVASRIPRVIHIASVPASDLGFADLSLEEIVAETLGVPYSSALSAAQYADVVNVLDSVELPPFPAGQSPLYESESMPLFAEAFLSLLTSDYYAADGYHLTNLARDRLLRERIGLPSGTLHTALTCLGARTSQTP